MTQPPATSSPSDPPDRRPPEGGAPGPRRRPSPALVVGVLMVLILVLALIGFFGARALMGDDVRGAQSATSPQQVLAAVPAAVAGTGAGADA